MAMHSALYYPHTDVRSEDLMKSALLTWDRLHTIVPFKDYRPKYGKNRVMAEAWEVIGEQGKARIVAAPDEQRIAHDSIVELLKAGLPPEFQFLAEKDRSKEPYEIWPQKFAEQTWHLMQQHELTGELLPNGDYPFTHEGGVLVMSKLADAIAGNKLARVTDQSLAFGMTADQTPDREAEQAVLVTLDLIDESRISLQALIDYRKREEKSSRKRDYKAMRRRYAKAVSDHVEEWKGLPTQRLRDQKNDDFKEDMQRDLDELSEAITGNKCELLLKPVIVATLVAAGTGIAAATGGAAAALYTAGTLALGATTTEIAEKLAKIVEQGFGYNKKQREAMDKHPMAYMYYLNGA